MKKKNMSNWVLIGLALWLVPPVSADTGRIKKCQDAQGHWHYGDFASQHCRNSVVSEMDENGLKRGEQAPPRSQEELHLQSEAEQQALQAAEQRRQDQTIINTYVSRATIQLTRDRNLTDIDLNLQILDKSRTSVLQDIAVLKTRQQSDNVKQLIAEREQAIIQYQQLIEGNMATRAELLRKWAHVLQQFEAAEARLEKSDKP